MGRFSAPARNEAFTKRLKTSFPHHHPALLCGNFQAKLWHAARSKFSGDRRGWAHRETRPRSALCWRRNFFGILIMVAIKPADTRSPALPVLAEDISKSSEKFGRRPFLFEHNLANSDLFQLPRLEVLARTNSRRKQGRAHQRRAAPADEVCPRRGAARGGMET